MWSWTHSGSGCQLTPAEDLAKQASLQSWECEVGCLPPAAVLCRAHTITFPLAARGSWGICLISWPQSTESLKRIESSCNSYPSKCNCTCGPYIHSFCLCLRCWQEQGAQQLSHKGAQSWRNTTCLWRAAGRKVEGNKRQLYPGHSLLYFNYQLLIYHVLLMTLWLKK